MSADPTAIDIEFDPTVQRMKGTAVHGWTPFDVPFISEVAPNLWQGGCKEGLILPEFIAHVVSLYPWERYTTRHALKSFLEVRQYDSEDDAGEQVADIAQWISRCRWSGPVLVHCQAGLNRSARVTAAVLMLDGYTAADAIKLLRDKRSPAVLCNPAFEAWLHDKDNAA